MPPARGCRLAGLPVLAALAPDGTSRPVVSLRLLGTQPAGARAERVMPGDGIDLVARRRLGDERLWWRVLDANPVRHPLDLAPGELLALPDVEQATRASRARGF